MKSLNKVQLIGRVGSAPEVRTVGNGSKVASFSLATSWGTGDKERTEWHRISCWDKLADVVEAYVAKGDPLYVEGEINYREYEKDGVKRTATEIRAFNVIMLGGGKKEPAKAAAPASGYDDFSQPEDPFGSDLPF